uniref:Uncharacterized protein n=1 Tax=Ceratitis capitata TaxID=7213 RepID=W8BAR6_CERCA
MATSEKERSFNYAPWVKLLVFSIYWFAFFPIMWFAIGPPAFIGSKTEALAYALLYFGIYIVLHLILCWCLKRRTKGRSEKVLRPHYNQTPEEITPEDVKLMNEAMETTRFSRKDRPTSKRVTSPKIPPPYSVVDAESNEYPYGEPIKTDSDCDSTITIPLYAKEDEKVRFVCKQELYFDGSSFRRPMCIVNDE